MFPKSRIARLEARQRHQHPAGDHFIRCVQVPWSEDTVDYLAQQPCPCGAGPGCPEKRMGLVVGRRCDSVEEWQARVTAYRAGHPEPPPAIPNADLTVILTRVKGWPDDTA